MLYLITKTHVIRMVGDVGFFKSIRSLRTIILYCMGFMYYLIFTWRRQLIEIIYDNITCIN